MKRIHAGFDERSIRTIVMNSEKDDMLLCFCDTAYRPPPRPPKRSATRSGAASKWPGIDPRGSRQRKNARTDASDHAIDSGRSGAVADFGRDVHKQSGE